MDNFRPLPSALIERIIHHARALGVATSAHEALAALFLLHSECKDAEAVIREQPAEVAATAAAMPEEV